MSNSNSLYLKLALMHLLVGGERLRQLAFDPAKHPRGKTSRKSRGGSFAPSSRGVAAAKRLESKIGILLQELRRKDLTEEERRATQWELDRLDQELGRVERGLAAERSMGKL